jgi:hypothetical protein
MLFNVPTKERTKNKSSFLNNFTYTAKCKNKDGGSVKYFSLKKKSSRDEV